MKRFIPQFALACCKMVFRRVGIGMKPPHPPSSASPKTTGASPWVRCLRTTTNRRARFLPEVRLAGRTVAQLIDQVLEFFVVN
jgi:hypothetical protein